MPGCFPRWLPTSSCSPSWWQSCSLSAACLFHPRSPVDSSSGARATLGHAQSQLKSSAGGNCPPCPASAWPTMLLCPSLPTARGVRAQVSGGCGVRSAGSLREVGWRGRIPREVKEALGGRPPCPGPDDQGGRGRSLAPVQGEPLWKGLGSGENRCGGLERAVWGLESKRVTERWSGTNTRVHLCAQFACHVETHEHAPFRCGQPPVRACVCAVCCVCPYMWPTDGPNR